MIATLNISALGIVTRKGAPRRVEGSDAQSSRSNRGSVAAWRLLLAILWGFFLLDGRVGAQQPGQMLPVSPLTAFAPSEAVPSSILKPITPSEPEVLPGFPQTPDQPASLYSPPSPAFRCDTSPGPYFDCDPRVDPPVLPSPGWFVDVEVGLMLPHVSNEIHDTVTVNGVTSRVQLPGATLDWAAAPRVELGYRLPDGFGEFALAYRFLGSQSSGTASGPFAAPDAPGSLLVRADIQTADLDYASNELSICSWWMKWRFGLRGADVYFDSQVDESVTAAAAGSGVFERKDTNNFWGIGPHTALEIERRLTQSGLMVIGRLDGSILLGRASEGFFETSTTRGGGGEFLTGQSLVSNGTAAPQIEGNIGLGWRPPSCPTLRVFAGYEYEHWWAIAHVPQTGSVGEIYDQGVLFRVDFNY
jgi:hypothetical protein